MKGNKIELNLISMPTKKLKNKSLSSQYNFMTYLTHLSHKLKNSEKVVKNMTLRSENWSKSCYETLSIIMREDLENKMSLEKKRAMGTSLSARTLQKIIENNYKSSYPIDPRTLNTLNKVVFFLEYDCWNDFVQKLDNESRENLFQKNLEEKIKGIVKDAITREYLMYYNLPKIDRKFLLEIHLKNSSASNMILDVLMDKSKKQHIISNPFNPSTYEILEMEVRKIEKNYVQVYTKEYWLLCWWDTIQKKYIKRHKAISDHFYVLNRAKGKWMIKANASTTDYPG